MNKILNIFLTLFVLLAASPSAQQFDYEKLHDKAALFTVAVNLTIEVSFGTQTTEVKSRGIGTIVSPEGLVLFDGTAIDSDDPFSVMAGMQVNAEPKNIEIVMTDGTTYSAEFIGVDRYTKIGFCEIVSDNKDEFEYARFSQSNDLKIGDWLVLFTLLPEYVSPPISADIGLVSAVVTEPEDFVLTAGFNQLELTSVLFDGSGNLIGILGNLNNPALTGFDATRMMESFSQAEDFMPLLGVLDADRLTKLINDPPRKGKPDRGWMGIYLQALTPDIAEFWGLQNKSGIIVNEVVNDSPAETAGLMTGDILTHIGGEQIEVSKEESLPIFQKHISEMGAGAEVNFTIVRRDSERLDTMDVTLILNHAPLSPAEAPEYEDDNFEMKIRDMVFADYNVFNLKPGTFKGIVVKEIERGGWFEVGGIHPGDIIKSIDAQTVESIEDAKVILAKIEENKPEDVVFFVWRNNKTLFINIKTNW